MFTSTGPCEEGQFQCGTGECLQTKLRCDDRPQCPDASDEALPGCLTTAAIVGLSVTGAVVVGAIIVAVVVACLVYKRRQRARIIKVRRLLHTFRLENKVSDGHLSATYNNNTTNSTNSLQWLDRTDSRTYFE